MPDQDEYPADPEADDAIRRAGDYTAKDRPLPGQQLIADLVGAYRRLALHVKCDAGGHVHCNADPVECDWQATQGEAAEQLAQAITLVEALDRVAGEADGYNGSPLAVRANEWIDRFVESWFEGRVDCPDCRHFAVDHAACSTVAGDVSKLVECVCSNMAHIDGRLLVVWSRSAPRRVAPGARVAPPGVAHPE